MQNKKKIISYKRLKMAVITVCRADRCIKHDRERPSESYQRRGRENVPAADYLLRGYAVVL